MNYLDQIKVLYAVLSSLIDKQPAIQDNDTYKLYETMERLKRELDYNFFNL